MLARAQEARAALQIWFCIDTLEYLQRGGRIGRAQAWLGSALKVKPILSLEAEITPVERVRTAGRAFERMVDYMRTRRDDGADGWVIQHIQAPERAAAPGRARPRALRLRAAWVSEVGPVIGTYTGPGLIGVGGVPGAAVRLTGDRPGTGAGPGTRGGQGTRRRPGTRPWPGDAAAPARRRGSTSAAAVERTSVRSSGA